MKRHAQAHKPAGKRGDHAESPFWISYADLMTALMVLGVGYVQQWLHIFRRRPMAVFCRRRPRLPLLNWRKNMPGR